MNELIFSVLLVICENMHTMHLVYVCVYVHTHEGERKTDCANSERGANTKQIP